MAVGLWAVKSAQLQYREDGDGRQRAVQVHGPLWTKHDEGEGPKCDAYPAGVPLILCTGVVTLIMQITP